MVAVGQQAFAIGAKIPGSLAAEVIGRNEVQRGPGLGLVFIVPMRVVPGLAILQPVPP